MEFIKKRIKSILLILLIWTPFVLVFIEFPNEIYDTQRSIYHKNPIQISFSEIKVSYDTGIQDSNKQLIKDYYTISTYPFYACGIVASVLAITSKKD